ncbi:MAG: LicD family protein [Hungatella sp.]|jgi:lipopolysaccharide cholinephosphotransferase|nr:LicD family protein [Hungatella sp.]
MAIISVNYYAGFMEEIYRKLDQVSYEKIVWFGECDRLSLVYDYLAADGYLISDVLDNDKAKWGKAVRRNWCMPFAFGYTKIPKKKADLIVAGKKLPKLTITSPEEFLRRNGTIARVLFLTSSCRADEIKAQLLDMGADPDYILILPGERAVWEEACRYIDIKSGEKTALTQEKRKHILIRLLEEFRRFCNEKNLRYYLAYGTLIGAVRHKGFIPWDDDIDILMPVEDYLRFLREYPGRGNYEVLDVSVDDNYFFPFAKLTDHETFLHHHGMPITWMQGMYIDIFPMSGFEKDRSFEEQWLSQTLLDIEWYWYYVSRNVIRKKLPDPRKRILEEKFRIGFDKADKVGVLTTLPARPWMLDRSVFGSGCELTFEGRTYKAPACWDRYLKRVYGDYMQIPPEDEQRIHGFPAYMRNM